MTPTLRCVITASEGDTKKVDFYKRISIEKCYVDIKMMTFVLQIRAQLQFTDTKCSDLFEHSVLKVTKHDTCL